MTKLLPSCKLLITILLLIVSCEIHAQRTNFRFHEYNKQNKLNEELVKYTVQDSLGIYYFATDAGVYSLINDNFFLYEVPKGKSRYFKELIRLKSGKLLALSDDAIYKINPSFESNDLELVLECNLDPVSPKYPKHVFEDKKQQVWISDYNHLYRLNNGTVEKYHMDEQNLTSSYARSFQFLECDNGNLIVVSQRGWFYNFNQKSNSFEKSSYQPGFLVHSSFKIGSNEFLLGTSQGIIKIIFDFKGRVVHTETISKDIIASCFEQIDQNRIIAGTWFQGLVEIELNKKHKFYPVGGFSYFTVNDIYKDDFGKFWVSTNSGVIVMEKKFFTSQFLTANSEYIANIKKSPDGKLICAGRSHLFKVVDEQHIDRIDIKFEGSLNVFQQFEEYTLIGTEQGQLLLYLRNELLKTIQVSSQSISEIEFDNADIAWVVADRELFQVNLDDGTIKSYFEDFNERRIVQDLFLSPTNSLFVGGEYQYSYLYQYNRNKDKFENISVGIPNVGNTDFWIRDMWAAKDTLYLGSSSGLYKYFDSGITQVNLAEYSDSEINAVVVDQFNALWVTTSHGVIRKRKDEVSLFTPEQGLPSKTFTVGNLIIDGKGFLWVGTSNGLAYARITDIIPNTPKPIVHIAKEESWFIQPNSFLEVTSGSMLLMDVTAIIYPQKQNQFQYCVMRGDDKIKDWKALSNKNQVIVSDLDPGNYEICIRCKHEGNYSWSENRVIPLRVNQVWYLRWYTILTEMILILLIVYLSSQYSKRRARQQMIDLERIVSERTAQLQDANENLLLANKAKDRFLSIIAHDLRNPFNAIRGFSKMLIRDTDMLSEEEKKELTEMIYKSSDDTFKLLESLLEWANVQKGKFKLNRVEFDLAEVLQTNLELHKSMASLKNINVKGDFKSLKVNADKSMVDTIIRNLMSNAIKFSHVNQTVLLSAIENDNFAIVQVKDEGVGMTETQVKNLFKIDTIVASEGTANETGTGFGLMLSKEFVQMNGGQIWVKSAKGKGTSFYFSIPL